MPLLVTDIDSVTPDEQEHIAQRLSAHVAVLLFGPCRSFHRFPFRLCKQGPDRVYVDAIIEHFEGPQQLDTVVDALNRCFLQDTWWRFRSPFQTTAHFEARRLEKEEGGIQLQLRESEGRSWEQVRQGLRDYSVAAWAPIDTYADFLQSAQIRIAHNLPFGETTARLVRFDAGPGVPLFVMVRLLHLLEHPFCLDEEEKEGRLGAIYVNGVNGLPCSGDAAVYMLHELLELTRAPPASS